MDLDGAVGYVTVPIPADGPGEVMLPVRGTNEAGEHQALIAANKLIDMLPQLVDAAARGIPGSRLTVLNGSQGVNEVATGVVAQGLSGYAALRESISRERESEVAEARDGSPPAVEPAVGRRVRSGDSVAKSAAAGG
jgi:hypothetical protein